MMIMKLMFWMMMVVMGVATGADGDKGSDHDAGSHRRLCDLLQAAIKKWEVVKNENKEGPLHKALEKTIFGKEGGGKELEKLRRGLPEDYHTGANGQRANWCGKLYSSEERVVLVRWPGHSAPHDLMCLCTRGENLWLTTTQRSGTDTLCGQDAKTLEDS
ncbi:unnamed protein product [Trypanosoma congolense IL3000]|uniref:WGS project CAEQ00000000 data, annotated contig 384 n=1 Tax=Trypanosoma congolense (strain IL3000) TaxID=1068625 RepID=F9WFG6_TRYCI|nr:unnamed protein product [Trypanosoma congolense IL3000]